MIDRSDQFLLLDSADIVPQLIFADGGDLLCQNHGGIENLLPIIHVLRDYLCMTGQIRSFQMPGHWQNIDRLRPLISDIVGNDDNRSASALNRCSGMVSQLREPDVSTAGYAVRKMLSECRIHICMCGMCGWIESCVGLMGNILVGIETEPVSVLGTLTFVLASQNNSHLLCEYVNSRETSNVCNIRHLLPAAV